MIPFSDGRRGRAMLSRILDPCRWVYASGRECGLPASDHGVSLQRGPQHEWSDVRRSTPRCVQCGAAVTGWGHWWPTDTVSCSDCYYADFG